MQIVSYFHRSRTQVVELRYVFVSYAVFLNRQVMSCISYVICIPVAWYSCSCYFHCYIGFQLLTRYVVNFILETTGNVMCIKVKSSGCL